MLFFFEKFLKIFFVTVAKLLRNCRNCYETVGTASVCLYDFFI